MTLFFMTLLAAAQVTQAAPSATVLAKPDKGSEPAICLVRKFKDSKDQEKGFEIIVPSSSSASLNAKGFKEMKCDTLKKRMVAYRDDVCRMAKRGNGAVMARYEDVFGARPDHLCAVAESLLASGE